MTQEKNSRNVLSLERRREIWDAIVADEYLDAIFRGSLEIEAEWPLTVWQVNDFLWRFPSRAAFRPVRQEFLGWAESEGVLELWRGKLDEFEAILY